MTVVAALRIEGIPALIGDFILTDGNINEPHIFLPTRPDINLGRIAGIDRRVIGMARKVHIFNDKFVAGFTGLVSAGKEIFTDLERRFSNKSPTIDDLNVALRQFNIKYSGSAYVVGWTVRSRPRCFLWEARPGSQVTKTSHSIAGSGAKHFADLLTSAHVGGYSTEVKIAWDKAALLGLTKIGSLLTEELSSGSNLAAAYGYGGEIVLWTASGFRSVKKLTHIFFNARIEANGNISIQPSNVSAVYENKGRYTVAQIAHITLIDGVLSATNTYVMAITPIHDGMPNLDVTTIGVIELEAPYYFLAISVLDVESGRTAQIRMTAQSGDDSPINHTKRDGLDYFQLKSDMIEYMVRRAFS